MKTSLFPRPWHLTGFNNRPYHWNHAAGANAVVDANHALVVGVLASAQEILVAQIVRSLVHHEAAALHPDGVAAVEVGVKVGTVADALMVPTLEISVLVEYDLQRCVTVIKHLAQTLRFEFHTFRNTQ